MCTNMHRKSAIWVLIWKSDPTVQLNGVDPMHNKHSLESRSSVLLRHKNEERKGGGHPKFFIISTRAFGPTYKNGQTVLAWHHNEIGFTTNHLKKQLELRSSNWLIASTHVNCGQNHVIWVPHNTKSAGWDRLDEHTYGYQHLAGYAKQGKCG